MKIIYNFILGDSSVGRADRLQRLVELAEDFVVALHFGVQQELAPIAQEARARLQRVIEALGG